MVVASRGSNFEYAVAKLEDRNVERAAAQVEDEDLLVLVRLVEAVGQSCGCRLVDDAQNLEACNLASVLRGLTLSVVEVCRNGDDGLGDGLAQLLFSVVLHLLQDHCRDLLGSVVLAVDLDDGTAVLALLDVVRNGLLLFEGLGVCTADEALDGADRVLGVRDCLVLCSLAYDTLAIFAEALDRRRGAVTLCVDEDFGHGALHDRHRRVGGAQVDTKNLCHLYYLSSLRTLLPYI